MARYDGDKDGRLNYDEFKEALLPRDPNYKSLCLARKSFCTGMNYARVEFFLSETNRELKNVLQLLINTEMRAERIRQGLVGRKNFDMDKAFEAIATSVKENLGERTKDDVIYPHDISKFLLDRNYGPTQA